MSTVDARQTHFDMLIDFLHGYPGIIRSFQVGYDHFSPWLFLVPTMYVVVYFIQVFPTLLYEFVALANSRTIPHKHLSLLIIILGYGKAYAKFQLQCGASQDRTELVFWLFLPAATTETSSSLLRSSDHHQLLHHILGPTLTVS